MLQVLMVISSFYPVIGGAEKQALLLAQALPELDFRVTVLTRRHPGMPDRQVLCGVETVRVGVHRRNKAGSFASALAWLRFCWEHRQQYDVYHAHQPFSSAWVVGLMGKLTGRPAIAKIPGTSTAKWLRWRCKPLAHLLDAVVVTNRESAAILESRFRPGQIRLIPNGVNLHEPAIAVAPRCGERTVLSVSRLEPGKGVDLLVRAWPKVVSAVPEARLAVVGAGSLKDELSSLVERCGLRNSIQFVGWVDPLKLRAWYGEAACFVQPSLNEGVSNSLLEAIAAKVPVVASRIPGNTDVVDEGMGLLYTPTDLNALADAIVLTLRDWRGARERAEKAYERVKQNFSITRIAKEYADLYWQLLAGGPK